MLFVIICEHRVAYRGKKLNRPTWAHQGRRQWLGLGVSTRAVSQIAYFCTKHLIFWVQKCTKCIHAEKYAKMQCTTHALTTVQKCVEWWTLHTLEKGKSQTPQLLKWWQDITAEDFRTPPTWWLWMSPRCTGANYTCFCTKHHYEDFCQIAAISIFCWVCYDLVPLASAS